MREVRAADLKPGDVFRTSPGGTPVKFVAAGPIDGFRNFQAEVRLEPQRPGDVPLQLWVNLYADMVVFVEGAARG
jgi:hypothetical protein